MNYPENCEVCGTDSGFSSRGVLDYDGIYDGDRRGDIVHECVHCHTLYRSRWRMVSFVRLVELVRDIEGNEHVKR